MISSKDFEKLWFLYQTEGASSGVSINSFCMQRGVPYSEFDKWYRKTWLSEVFVELSRRELGAEMSSEELEEIFKTLYSFQEPELKVPRYF